MRAAKSVVVLQAVVEARPGRDERERAWLLHDSAAALASLGTEEARRAFDDFLASPHRDVRLAAMNVAVTAFPQEREALLAAWVQDADPVVRVKAEALRAAVRKP